MQYNRHKKFSSIGRDLTSEINQGHTYKTKRKITQIVIHCADTPPGKYFDAFDIDKWHLQRWGKKSGIGYHYVILLDGSIQKGRWVDYTGAHVKGHNRNSIGICYIGGKNAYNSETPEQLKSMVKLVQVLLRLYSLSPENVLGHNEFKGVTKDCPCLDMHSFRKML